MKTSAKKIILAAITIAAVASTSVPAQAGCGGGGGGLRLGISQSHYGHRNHAPVHHHHAPVGNYAPAQNYAPFQHSTPVYQSAPVNYSSAPQRTQVGSSPVVRSQQTFAQQPAAQQNFAQQSAPQQPAAQQTATQQPAPSQPTAIRSAATQAVAQRPAAQPATASTEASALAMLASINQPESKPAESQIPQFSTASTTTAAPHVGSWSVNLPGDQTVSLTLSNDKSFIWTATKGGSTSSFRGQYRLDGNRLSLVRAADLKKMEGDWTTSQTGFVFKVDGENTGGLNFSKS